VSANSIIHHPFIKVLVYANVFIALCAFAQVLLTQLLFKLPFNPDNISYLALIPLSTYIQYNIQRGYMINPQNYYTDRSQWLLKNKKKMLISMGICLLILLFLCWSLSWKSVIVLFGAELISTLYFLPPFNLRKFGYVKPFLISAVWVVSCVVVPLIENKMLDAGHAQNYLFIAAQFLFIAELCMVFDIKDAGDDFIAGVYTYANVWGTKFTKVLCTILLIASGVNFWLFDQKLSWFNLVPLLISLVFTLLSTDKKHGFWFYLAIDGLLILQLLFLSFALL